MREIIRFAWGISTLGDFVVAMSEKGIVALEFGSVHAAMEDALALRLPDADIERDQTGLAEVIGKLAGLIDDPATNCDVPLDMRGTPYGLNFIVVVIVVVSNADGRIMPAAVDACVPILALKSRSCPPVSCRIGASLDRRLQMAYE